MTSVKETGKLVVGVDKIFKTVFPQSHVLETAK